MNADPMPDDGLMGVPTRHAHRIAYATIVLIVLIVALGRFDASDDAGVRHSP